MNTGVDGDLSEGQIVGDLELELDGKSSIAGRLESGTIVEGKSESAIKLRVDREVTLHIAVDFCFNGEIAPQVSLGDAADATELIG